MSEKTLCELCGEPMPEGEEMFKYHGFSGDCPKEPLERLRCVYCNEQCDGYCGATKAIEKLERERDRLDSQLTDAQSRHRRYQRAAETLLISLAPPSRECKACGNDMRYLGHQSDCAVLAFEKAVGIA